jgi:hypothetical protein
VHAAAWDAELRRTRRAQHVRFKGWLTRRKKLGPGRYTLVIEAITPGVGTTTQKLKFTIVR